MNDSILEHECIVDNPVNGFRLAKVNCTLLTLASNKFYLRMAVCYPGLIFVFIRHYNFDFRDDNAVP